MSDIVKYIEKEAQFSDCGRYRYWLKRKWSDQPLAMVIGLNPSTADSDDDDATINILKKLLSPLGYGGVYMCNLFAWISTEPEDLRSCSNPLGDNDEWLDIIRAKCQHVVFAWGSFKQAEYRAKRMIYKYPDAYVFGMTKKRKPLHPLAAAVWQKKLFNFKQYHLS
jgi:hypothetical protein